MVPSHAVLTVGSLLQLFEQLLDVLRLVLGNRGRRRLVTSAQTKAPSESLLEVLYPRRSRLAAFVDHLHDGIVSGSGLGCWRYRGEVSLFLGRCGNLDDGTSLSVDLVENVDPQQRIVETASSHLVLGVRAHLAAFIEELAEPTLCGWRCSLVMLDTTIVHQLHHGIKIELVVAL